jgi:hypothetical protein
VLTGLGNRKTAAELHNALPGSVPDDRPSRFRNASGHRQPAAEEIRIHRRK